MRAVVRYGMALIIFGVCSVGCLDPYEPPVTNDDVEYTVIEGYVNTTDNQATVNISRAIPLPSETEFPKETGASVFIETESHSFINLPEVEPGKYSANSFFDITKKYRLNITIRGEKYISDYIPLQKVASIDSLTWFADNDKLQVMVNTHDFSEGTKFYKYNFEETYEYRSSFFSSYKLINGNPIYRLPDEEINRCWISKLSTSILIGSTESLSQNIIADLNILEIEKGDSRLFYQYSALVKQTALTEEAYHYWKNLRNLTESLGGLFDPIPFQVKGNIYSPDNPEKVVIGYFSGGEVSEQRIVLKIGEYPYSFQLFNASACEEYFIPIAELSRYANSNIILTRAEYVGITVVGYWYSAVPCVDCRTGGGTNVKPDFMY